LLAKCHFFPIFAGKMFIYASNMSIFAGKMSIFAGNFSHVSTLMTWKPGAGPRAADPTSEEGGRRAEGAEHPPFIDVFPSKKMEDAMGKTFTL